MGGDGGAKPLGRKYLRSAKTKTKLERANKVEVSVARYTNCALTDQTLREPVVCCRLGNMFNKVALIESILSKSMPKEFKHIKGMKDFVTLKFTKNPGFKADVSVDSNYWSPCSGGKFMCPVTRVEMNGRHPFSVIWKSGVVVSKRCLKEIPHKELYEVVECEFADDDVINLNPDEKEYETMKLKWKVWYKNRKERSKKKKRKRSSRDDGDDNDGDSAKKYSRKKIVDEKTKKRKETTAMRSASKMSTEAMGKIEEKKKKSSVYDSLFSKSENVKTNDLFIRNAPSHDDLG